MAYHHEEYMGGDTEESLGIDNLHVTNYTAEIPTTSYPAEIQTKLQSAAEKEYTEYKDMAKLHQFLSMKYMTALQRNGRGILVYHEVGTGKTRLSILIARYFAIHDPGRSIIVLAPKSLHENTRNTVNAIDKEHQDSYRYVSLNASNMFSKVTQDDKDSALEKNLGEFAIIHKSLENTLLIIDEFHNLSNAICNGSGNAVKLYNKIMSTRNIRLVFLTGTPMVNTPFELVPTFNMLRAYTGHAKRRHKETLLPEYVKDFNKFFVDADKNAPKNEALFMNRIFGLVSFYGTDTTKNPDFPRELDMMIVRAGMSNYQFSQYRTMRDIELKEESRRQGKKREADPFTKSGGPQSSYRIRSRQTSDFAMPESLIEFKGSKVTRNTAGITAEMILDPKYSPKYAKLMENLGKHPSTVGVIYSEFIAMGIEMVARLLEANGWVAYRKGQGGAKGGKCYAVISGDVAEEARVEIQRAITDRNNMHGEQIALLLISKTGAEGLDLKYVRHIHILEPFWNYARITQIVARGVRYRSHADLPPNERDVQPYIYLAGYPEDLKEEEKALLEPLTTDENMYINAVRNKQLIDRFATLLVRASFDCISNKSHKECLRCYPDGIALYRESAAEDVRRAINVCRPLEENEVEAQEIIVETPTGPRTYYYQKNAFELKIFYFDDMLQGYVALPETDPSFGEIAQRIE